MTGAQWSRAARGYELKIYSGSAGVVQLDGFVEDVRDTFYSPSSILSDGDEIQDFDRIEKCFKVWYGLTVEQKEHALRGWNWGKGEFGKHELAFNVQNKPAFEIPYSEISNTNLAGKNELAVEFFLPANGEDAPTKRARGRKAGGGRDQLVEMRFYIPGTAKRDVDEDVDGSVNGDNEQEEENAANLFYNTLMDKAEIGDVAGDTFATFLDVLHLTPRLVLVLGETRNQD